MTLVKWFIYTVLLALTPIMMRLLVVGLTPGAQIKWFDHGDVISYGLVLGITNISGLESGSRVARDWKTIQIGVSLLAISVFAVMFAVSCLAEAAQSKISSPRLLGMALLLSAASTFHSYSIWSRLSAVRKREQAT